MYTMYMYHIIYSGNTKLHVCVYLEYKLKLVCVANYCTVLPSHSLHDTASTSVGELSCAIITELCVYLSDLRLHSIHVVDVKHGNQTGHQRRHPAQPHPRKHEKPQIVLTDKHRHCIVSQR